MAEPSELVASLKSNDPRRDWRPSSRSPKFALRRSKRIRTTRIERKRLMENLRDQSVWPQIVAPKTISYLGFTLSPELWDFARLAAATRSLTRLEDDWDNEGSLGFGEDTWHRVISLVLSQAVAAHDRYCIVLAIPSIQKGTEGDLEIYWEQGGRKLLINVPSTADESASFYGRDWENELVTIRGSLDSTESAEWIASWLASQD